MINVVDWKIENESILEKKWKKKKKEKPKTNWAISRKIKMVLTVCFSWGFIPVT